MVNGSACPVLLVALAAFGCGSNTEGSAPTPDEPLSCEEFTACAGNVVGRWSFRSVCPTEQQRAALNDAAQLCEGDQTTVETSFEGSVTFGQDGSVQRAITAQFQVKQSVPTSCLSPGFSCTMLQSAFADQPAVSRATCTTKGSSCECSYRIVQASSMQETYSTTGAKLNFTSSADGSESSVAFCVRGTSLSLSDEDGVYVLTR